LLRLAARGPADEIVIGTESDGGRPVANLEATLTAGSMFGGYRIESFLARGGMGVIYRATQLALQRIVALKVVAPELAHDESFRERFKREALLAASLDHPNILPIYEAGEIDGQLFLAMRLVVGSDLDSLIQREQALAPERAAAIVEQVASALDAAHGRGLVHRDVKPGNILIAEEYGQERAYLTDFGLTKNAGTAARLTKTGQMVGTLDYVAPEQVQGGAIDGRADSYALACVLYRAVTGRLPFDRPGDIAKMRAHLNDPPPSAAAVSPAVSSELDAVIRRGMAKRPEDRYASSGEFARAARSAAGQVTPGQLARPEPEATQIDSTFVGPRLDAIPEPASDKPRTGGSPEARGPLARIRARFYLAGALAIALAAIIAIVAGGGGGKAPVTGGSATRPSTTTAASTTAGSPLRTVAATPTTTTTSPAAAQAAVYHARVARIIPRLHAVFRRFPKGSDFGQAVFSRTALSVAAGLRGIADDLDALSPPAKILVDHEALVTHLHEMEQAFRSLAADSENRDFSGAVRDLQKSKAALARINPSVRRVQANR
jgi:serine/threonine protein kinase